MQAKTIPLPFGGAAAYAGLGVGGHLTPDRHKLVPEHIEREMTSPGELRPR